jgi:hypothetical protein
LETRWIHSFFSALMLSNRKMHHHLYKKCHYVCYTLKYRSFLKVMNGTCAWCLIDIMFHAHRHQTPQERMNRKKVYKTSSSARKNFKALVLLIYKRTSHTFNAYKRFCWQYRAFFFVVVLWIAIYIIYPWTTGIQFFCFVAFFERLFRAKRELYMHQTENCI